MAVTAGDSVRAIPLVRPVHPVRRCSFLPGLPRYVPHAEGSS
ncbi:hypothetical protein GZL_08347 [Streptomyces sp. 769]|nr:hypothetical protein GZL_08347 [Streptomyces sp. 769]